MVVVQSESERRMHRVLYILRFLRAGLIHESLMAILMFMGLYFNISQLDCHLLDLPGFGNRTLAGGRHTRGLQFPRDLGHSLVARLVGNFKQDSRSAAGAIQKLACLGCVPAVAGGDGRILCIPCLCHQLRQHP